MVTSVNPKPDARLKWSLTMPIIFDEGMSPNT